MSKSEPKQEKPEAEKNNDTYIDFRNLKSGDYQTHVSPFF